MLPDFEPEQSPQANFTDQFLEDYIHSQKAKLQTRKLVEEFLFFTSCQVASASLALVLFQFAVQTVFTVWLCLFVAWIPSLSALTEIHFQKTQDGWTLQIMNRPVTTLIKFCSSVGIVTVTIYSIAYELDATLKHIYGVYNEIQQYEHPRVEQFLPPFFWQVVLASIGIVLLFGFVKSANDSNPFK